MIASKAPPPSPPLFVVKAALTGFAAAGGAEDGFVPLPRAFDGVGGLMRPLLGFAPPALGITSTYCEMAES